MRAILVLSLAATTAIVSTAALGAGEGQGIIKRRVGGGGGQQFVQPAVKPAGQGARFNRFDPPPVQTIAPAGPGPERGDKFRFSRLPHGGRRSPRRPSRSGRRDRSRVRSFLRPPVRSRFRRRWHQLPSLPPPRFRRPRKRPRPKRPS